MLKGSSGVRRALVEPASVLEIQERAGELGQFPDRSAMTFYIALTQIVMVGVWWGLWGPQMGHSSVAAPRAGARVLRLYFGTMGSPDLFFVVVNGWIFTQVTILIIISEIDISDIA